MDQGTKKPITVVLADDHPLLREGFSQELAGHQIEVVAQTATAEGAIRAYEQHKPDVLVLDIRFGDELSGFDAAQAVLRKYPEAKIIFFSQFDQDNLIKEAYRLGGLAFFTKDADTSHLANAIERVSEGQSYFLPEIALRLAQLAIHGDTSPRALLEEREVEVFTFMAQGLTNVEIAEKLGLSPKTISNVSQSVKTKLGVERQAELTLLAVKYQMIKP